MRLISGCALGNTFGEIVIIHFLLRVTACSFCTAFSSDAHKIHEARVFYHSSLLSSLFLNKSAMIQPGPSILVLSKMLDNNLVYVGAQEGI